MGFNSGFKGLKQPKPKADHFSPYSAMIRRRGSREELRMSSLCGAYLQRKAAFFLDYLNLKPNAQRSFWTLGNL